MNGALRVMKFGGTSLGDAQRIRGAAEIVAQAAQIGPVVTVVSAMAGVTNSLVAAAEKSAGGDAKAAARLADQLTARHREAVEALLPDRVKRETLLSELAGLIEQAADFCRGCALLGELTPRTMDAIAGTGERLSARIFAAALDALEIRALALDATQLIVTDEVHGAANPLADPTREKTRAALLPLLAEKITPVVTGFIAATAKGVSTTLGRGGSDYSATLLGAALGASEVIIWTDVDGVLTADPRIVPDAVPLEEISYAEAADLAFFGAKVLHPLALRPVAERGIPVWIRSSFEPHKPGTKISRSAAPRSCAVKGVTAIRGLSLLRVGGPGLAGKPEIAAKIFAATSSVRAQIVMIAQASSQDNLCLAIRAAEAARTERALRRSLAADMRHHQVEHITQMRDVAIVSVVGEEICGAPAIAGRLFSALGEEGIRVLAIAQGLADHNISCLVSADAADSAIAALHHAFRLAQRATPETAMAAAR